MKYVLLLLILISSAYGQAPSRTYEQFVPTGAFMQFAIPTCPNGYALMNGASVLKTRVAKLHSLMGNIHGDGSTNPAGVTADVGCPHATLCTNLPDYRGRFARMSDLGAGRDTGIRTSMANGASATGVGSVQQDETGPHTHASLAASSRDGFPDGSGDTNAGTGYWRYGTTYVDTTANSGVESRPKNGSALFCIKL